MKRTEQDLDNIIQQLASATRSPKGKYAADESYKLLQQRLNRKKRRFRLFYTAASAAAALLICVAAWSVYHYIQPGMIIESTFAEVKTITLPDGSEVILNHYTTLQYPDKFTKGNRLVALTGEAYFEVARDEKKPFIVETGSVKTKVLGTRFNVEAYANDPHIKTTLLEGSVAVYDDINPQIILKPNESAIYDKEKLNLILNPEQDAAGEIRWKDGILNFPNITLEQIARQLSNRFGVTIRIEDDELLNFRMTATFSNDESLDDILDMLKTVGEFEYKTAQHNNIIIYNSKID